MLALIRPDSWNFPLLIHVFGAMALVGGLTSASIALLQGWRRDSATLTRLGFKSLLFVAVPGWIVMRVGAQWIYSREGFGRDNEPDWIVIGYSVADIGLPLFIIGVVVAGIAARRARTAEGPSTISRASGVLSVVLLIAYVVATWAMTAKPGS